MKTRYVAFGLELCSAFPLAGMQPTAGSGLPALTLEFATPAELDSRWSGAHGRPEWQGLLGDGRRLTIERGACGDRLFTYDSHAKFCLDSSQRRLDCAPLGRGLEWQRALIGKVVPSISVMRGYEALHAGAVDSPDGVVAIAGPSGAGKSTLVAEFVSRGWPLFADDELTLEKIDAEVRAHPGSPHMNVATKLPGDLDAKRLGTLLGVLSGEHWLTVLRRVTSPRPVRMICLLERRRGLRLGAYVLSANPLLLAAHMLGLSTDARRLRTRFCLYADLVERTSLVRLTGGPQSAPADLADVLENALATRSMLLEGVA